MAFINTIKLLRFAIILRLNLIFRGNYVFLKILALLGILLLAVFYAHTLSKIIAQLEIESEEIGEIWMGLNILTLCYLSLKNIFPFYKTKSELFSRLYPVQPLIRIFFSFMYEVIAYSYAFVIFFFASIAVFSLLFKTENIINIIFIILLSYLLERLLRKLFNTMSGKRKLFFITGFLLSVTLLFASHIWIYFQMPQLWIINIIYMLNFIVTFIIYYLMEKNNFEGKNISVDQREKSFWSYIFISIYLKNREALNAMIIVFVVKVAILIFITFALSLKKVMPIFVYNFWLAISPVTLFSYIHNNIFGYFRELFLSIELHKGSIVELLIAYFKLLVVPLLFDVMIFLLFTLINNKFSISSVLFYIFTLIILALSGFQFSIRQFCLIDNNITFKNTTSFFSVLASFFVVTILYLTKSNLFYFFISIFVFSVIVYLYAYSFEKVYSRKKYLIYEKLLINPR